MISRWNGWAFIGLGCAVVASTAWTAEPAAPLLSRVTFEAPVTVETSRTVRFYVAERAGQPPKIDGLLDDACWKGAAVADGFQVLGHPVAAEPPTRAYLVFDANNLYVAYDCFEKSMDKLRAFVTKDDTEGIWEDDCIEFFLDPQHNQTRLYQLIVNPAGALFNSMAELESAPGAVGPIMKSRPGWRSGAEVKASRQSDRWVVEMRIPFKSMNLPAPTDGSVWGVNFNRNRATARELSNWAHLSGKNGHLAPEGFGNLIFGRMPAFIERGLPGTPGVGLNALSMQIRNPGHQPADVKLALAVSGKPAAESRLTIPADSAVTAVLEYGVAAVEPGTLDLNLLEAASGKRLGAYHFAYTPPAPVICKPASPSVSTGARNARAFVTLFVGSLSLPKTSVLLQLADGQGKVLREGTVEHPTASKLTAYLNLGGLPPGKYTLVCQALDAAGKVLGQARSPMQVTANPFDF